MSKELVSSIDIAAPAERVWEVLIDFAAFPAWNPFITQAEGRLEVGGRLALRMQPVGRSAVTLATHCGRGGRRKATPLAGPPGGAPTVRCRPSVHRGAACCRFATRTARAIQRSASAVPPGLAGAWHAAGVPRDEHRA
jgi:Polyketide cyclase / dehydrase and lipid transport